MDNTHGGGSSARLDFSVGIPLPVLPVPLIAFVQRPRQPPETNSDSLHFPLRQKLLGMLFYGYYDPSTALLSLASAFFKPLLDLSVPRHLTRDYSGIANADYLRT